MIDNKCARYMHFEGVTDSVVICLIHHRLFPLIIVILLNNNRYYDGNFTVKLLQDVYVLFRMRASTSKQAHGLFEAFTSVS